MKNKFITSRGWHTTYALACGYIDVTTNCYEKEGIQIRLWKDSSNTFYHVRVDNCTGSLRLSWDTFLTLTEARKYFSNMCKKYKVERKVIQPKIGGNLK